MRMRGTNHNMTTPAQDNQISESSLHEVAAAELNLRDLGLGKASFQALAIITGTMGFLSIL